MTQHEQIRQMLSAYLDGELTQADDQRVRIHLEDCEECRRAFHELEQLRKVTGELAFLDPPEDKMDALNQRFSVQAPLRVGWVLILSGVAGWAAYALYLFLTNPPALTPATLIAAAFFIGMALLLVSVARQRWLELPHDRYRGIKK